jgi:colanic acid/amylovoran biosynthesis glycosyltransferase
LNTNDHFQSIPRAFDPELIDVRVAYFTNQYPAGSHTFIRREIRAVEALGVEVLRYSLRPGKDLVDSEDKKERELTNYVLKDHGYSILRCGLASLLCRPLKTGRVLLLAIRIGWRSDRGFLRHLAYAAEAAVIAHWCRRDTVQHVHAHFGTNSATIAMLASELTAIPYSFTAHGPEEFIKWPNVGLAEAIRRCAFVIAISSYARSQLYCYADRHHWHKVHVVHCGLEPTAFAEVASAEAEGRRFVCVGRLSPEKGHLLLLEAARRLAAQGENFELVLVGDGKMRGEIESLATTKLLQNKIRITGWLDGEQVRKEVSAARALVQPSFAEGLPVVIMEAMALGRPVISTFVAGIPELVLPGENGWLIAAGDVDALSNAMRACLHASVGTLSLMGKAGRERAFQRHNVEREAVTLVNLFESAPHRWRHANGNANEDDGTLRKDEDAVVNTEHVVHATTGEQSSEVPQDR